MTLNRCRYAVASLMLRTCQNRSCSLFFCERRNSHHFISEFNNNNVSVSGHTPVLVNEVLQVIRPRENQTIVDMTFGAGGHTRAILDQCSNLTVYAIDRDPAAYERAIEMSKSFHQLKPLLGRFSEVEILLNEVGVSSVDGILFDVGGSSMQYDDPCRGFSIRKPGPLDMRMDGIRGDVSAEDIVNYMSEEDLVQIIKKYGEEKKALTIARAIIDSRNTFGRIKTTNQLSNIVVSAYEGLESKTDKIGRPSHVATKTFQALRIFVNDELNELYNGLQVAHRILSPGGVCIVISFQSLEDRIVKRHFHGIDMDAKLNMSITDRHRNPGVSVVEGRKELERLLENKWEPISRQAVLPTEAEIRVNPRSRSAKLRAAKKKTEET